jgi:HPt (histidine-containing phosphotransfer) domain-containing protein
VFDVDKALARVDGDRAFLLEMAELMNDDVASQMAAIRAAMEQGDADTRRRATHTLKSTVGTFAATAAYEAALRLEKMDDGQPAADVAAAYRHLDEEINRFLPALREWARAEAVTHH